MLCSYSCVYLAASSWAARTLRMSAISLSKIHLHVWIEIFLLLENRSRHLRMVILTLLYIFQITLQLAYWKCIQFITNAGSNWPISILCTYLTYKTLLHINIEDSTLKCLLRKSVKKEVFSAKKNGKSLDFLTQKTEKFLS